MIIITLPKAPLKALSSKIEKLKASRRLFEIRLDYFTKYDFKELKKIANYRSVLFTYRSSFEGGETFMPLSKRHQLLKTIIGLKPAYLDLEYKRDQPLLPYLKKKSPKTKLILSYHDFSKIPHRLENWVSKLKAHSAWKYKIMGMGASIIDALKMLELTSKHKDVIALSMGESGKVSRILSPIFKQTLTFACLTNPMAPGQLNYQFLEEHYRYHQLNSKTKILGVVGDPVSQSLGPSIYNRVFCKLKLNAIYLPFKVSKNELSSFIRFAKILKFKGVSVTAPHKIAIKSFVDRYVKEQKNIPSINTLDFTSAGVRGMNTDCLGGVDLIEALTSLESKKILFIGCGGTALSLAHQLAKKNSVFCFANRSIDKAKLFAKQFEGRALSLNQLSQLKSSDYDIMIHATTVGTVDPKKSLVPKSSLFPKKMVMDVVLKNTKLLHDAKNSCCQVISGKDFWSKQGFLQLKFWFKKLSDFTSQDLLKEII